VECEWSFLSVDLELTNRCRENCAMCPRQSLIRPQGDMTEEVFSRVLAALVRFGSRVTFSGFGNPTLHPRWAECLTAVRAAGLPAGMVLHPSALTPEIVRQLQEHPPSHLEISFPTVDPVLFARLCPQADFAVAVARVVHLRRLHLAPMVCVGLATAHPAMSAAAYRHFWKQHGLRSRFFPCHSRGGHLQDRQLVQARPVRLPSCGLLAVHAFVAWNGDLLACCHDLSGVTRIGNLAVDDAHHLAREKVRLASKPPWPPCRDCDEFRKGWPLPAGECPADPVERGRRLAALTAARRG
jgi:hypothetical protein